MADQPTITNSDTSDIMTFNPIYRDRTITVAAGEVLARGTILGYNTTTNKYVACISTGVAGEDYPRYILMEALDNSAGGAPVDFANIQVAVSGEFDSANIVFDNGTDTLATEGGVSGVKMIDALTAQGLIATVNNDLSVLDNQ